MRVVITGGTGFLGQMLARSILKRGHLLTHGLGGGAERMAPVTELLLVDIARPKKLLFEQLESQAQVIVGDVSDAGLCKSLLGGTSDKVPVSIFHLGAVMSGQVAPNPTHGLQHGFISRFAFCIRRTRPPTAPLTRPFLPPGLSRERRTST